MFLDKAFILSNKDDERLNIIIDKYFEIDEKIYINNIDKIINEKNERIVLIITTYNNISLKKFIDILNLNVFIISLLLSQYTTNIKTIEKTKDIFANPSNDLYFYLKLSNLIISNIALLNKLFSYKFVFEEEIKKLKPENKYIISINNQTVINVLKKTDLLKSTYYYQSKNKNFKKISDNKIVGNKILDENTIDLQINQYTKIKNLKLKSKNIFILKNYDNTFIDDEYHITNLLIQNDNDDLLFLNEKQLIKINKKKIENIFNTSNTKPIDIFEKNILLKSIFFDSIKENSELIFIKNNKVPDYTIFFDIKDTNKLYNSIKAIENIDKNYSFILKLMDFSSQEKKNYNGLIELCKTRYFLIIDHEIMIKQNIFDIIENTIKKNEDNYLIKYNLLKKTNIINNRKLKVYNNVILNNFSYLYDDEEEITKRLFFKNIVKYNFNKKNKNQTVGYYFMNKDIQDILNEYINIAKNLITNNYNKKYCLQVCNLLMKFNSTIFLLIIKEICNTLKSKSIFINYKDIAEIIINILNICLNYKSDLLRKYSINSNSVNNFINNIISDNIYTKNKISLSEIIIDNKIPTIALIGIIYGLDKNNNDELNIDNIFDNFTLNRKVLIISSQIPENSGSSMNNLSLHNYLINNNIQSKLVIFDENKTLNKINQDFLYYEYSNDIIIVKKDFLKKTFKDFNLIVNKIFNYEPDIIINGSTSAHLSNYNMKTIFPQKSIVTFVYNGINLENNSYSLNDMFLKKYVIEDRLKEIINNSDYLISNCFEYNEIIDKKYREKNLDFVILSSLNRFNYKEIFSSDKTNNFHNKIIDIMFITSDLDDNQKNINKLIEIFSDKRLENRKKVVIGKNYEKYIDILNKHNVQLYDYTSNGLESIYSNTKLIINTSYFDSSIYTLFEGIYFGSNILVSNNTGNSYLFNNNCKIKNYNDINEWVDKIDILCENYQFPFISKQIEDIIRKNVENIIKLFDKIIINNSEKKHIIFNNL